MEIRDAEALDIPSPQVIIRKLVIGLSGLVILVAFLGWALRAPIEAASGAFVARFGLTGVFFGVFFLDVMPIATHDPMLFAGLSGGLPYRPLAATGMAATSLAALFDWGMGRLIGASIPGLRALADRWRIPAFLEKHGAWAIALTALLPMPFALVAWASGMTGGPFAHIALGAVLRASKLLLTVTLIAIGWSFGG